MQLSIRNCDASEIKLDIDVIKSRFRELLIQFDDCKHNNPDDTDMICERMENVSRFEAYQLTLLLKKYYPDCFISMVQDLDQYPYIEIIPKKSKKKQIVNQLPNKDKLTKIFGRDPYKTSEW